MGFGAALTIIATFLQTFAPRGNLGVFIGGRVIIGLGQGVALSMSLLILFRFIISQQFNE